VVHIAHRVGEQSWVGKLVIVDDVDVGACVITTIRPFADVEWFLDHVSEVPPLVSIIQASDFTALLLAGSSSIIIASRGSALFQTKSAVSDLSSGAFDRFIRLEDVVVSLFAFVIGKASGLVSA